MLFLLFLLRQLQSGWQVSCSSKQLSIWWKDWACFGQHGRIDSQEWILTVVGNDTNQFKSLGVSLASITVWIVWCFLIVAWECWWQTWWIRINLELSLSIVFWGWGSMGLCWLISSLTLSNACWCLIIYRVILIVTNRCLSNKFESSDFINHSSNFYAQRPWRKWRV